MSGSGSPFNNIQPSLAVTEVTPLAGVFPSGGGGGNAVGDTLGFVYAFAGNYAPGTSMLLQGETLSVASDPVLFTVIGTTYGGNGTTSFVLPNLQGNTVIGAGTGAGLSPQTLGVATGSATVALSASQLPPNDPSLPGGGDGGGQPFSNMQPSLPLQQLIAVSGTFPDPNGTTGSATFIGQVASFAGTVVPGGWLPADGQLLPINGNSALFSVLGTTYGGDGKTDFALPDLQGRVAVGADNTDPLGTAFGQDTTTLSSAQLPGGGVAGSNNPGLPVNNDQPSLALNYLICTTGMFPDPGSGAGFDPNTPTVGEIVEFAGNYAPPGWAFANGQTLAISSNTALFSILGTQYGGDGKSTFVLPDLSGRTLVGTGTSVSGSYIAGQVVGSDTVTLTAANLPAEDQPLCFCAGTRIATPIGEVAVEQLAAGDLVLTAAGAVRPITWIGSGRVSTTPVIVRQGALSENIPNRDLRITKGHSLYIDGALIPVEFLVNYRSIIWDVSSHEVEIYHIELAKHDVLLADGAPAESYRDDGNRWLFQNNSGRLRRQPKPPCAPVLTGGPTVDAIWRHLLDRAGTRPAMLTTDEPDLHLLVDGKRTDGRRRPNGVHQFRLPRKAREIRVVSRTGVQAALGLTRDPRPLGVALKEIRLWRGAHLRMIDARDPSLGQGFHAFEEVNGFLWTDGDARLPATLCEDLDGPCELELHVACTARYPLFVPRDSVTAG